MEPDLEPLDETIQDAGADGYLLHDASANADVRYLSGFDAPDPFVTLYQPGTTSLLVSELEYGRARTESRADVVARYSEYDYQDRVAEHGRHEGAIRTVAAFLDDRGVEGLLVPKRFPFGTAEGLRDRGLTVDLEVDGVLGEIRAVKHPAEIEHVRETQAINQRAMAVAESMIARAEIADGTLVLEGEPLTSERVKQAIELELLENRTALDETIVAGGEQSADPHDRGSGPLPANEPIIVDIFPKHKETRYFGDLTRTFVRGEPTDEVAKRYAVTREAYEAALGAVEPGVSGEAVHDVACDVIEEAGYATLRSDPGAETGFIHGTGHGVGLEVHEGPRIAPGGETLEPGHVITIEPGLYDPVHGGVRIEDLVVVTEDGYENLTDYPVDITPHDRE